MIEGGKAGASALALAAQRRADVERLVAEAQHYETLAADERIMAAQLATLPPNFVILHDLRVPDLATTVDHVVVGQGGAFLVITRRCPDPIAVHGGDLWSGDVSLRPDVDNARIASALLTRALATPVVPLLGFVGTVVPAGMPPVVQGVLICSADNVVRVVTRASHTLLTPGQLTDVVQRAVPMLTVATSIQRHDPGAYHAAAEAARAALAAPPEPTQPAPSPGATSPAESVATSPETVAAAPALPESRPEREPVPESAGEAEVEPVATAPAARRRWWSRIGVGVVVVAALVVGVVAVGGLVRTLWSGDAKSEDRTPATSAGPTTTSPYVPGPSHPTLGDEVEAPAVSFVATCPAKGAGWTLTPNWPGDLPHLAEYVVEVRDLQQPWHRLGAFTSRDDVAKGALVHQKPGATSGVRITAVMSDGSRSPTAPAIVAAPRSAC